MNDEINDALDLLASEWADYALLDSGSGRKLERYGKYRFIRPEAQAIWRPADDSLWKKTDAIFIPQRSESGGYWKFTRPINKSWHMHYKDMTFKAETTGGRHLGMFPEQAVHWDWIADVIQAANRSIQVLNLFGYTGLATLAAAKASARVTHVDASRKVVRWAKENQHLSGLDGFPIRWIVDDALKYINREIKRGVTYDGIILDPPRFGRGPGGETWKFFDLLPLLLSACRSVLSEHPLFIVITAYAVPMSAICLKSVLQEHMTGLAGKYQAGELILREESAQRLISTAIFVRWQAE
jgi:23S rRNA (cytosine1962-C5)-methyltransferase